jgi:hypothetical protein
MEYALLGKLLVEAVAATAVLVAAVLFLRDRRTGRAADLRDRAAERAALLRLLDNAVAHNTAAVEANTRQQAAAAESLGRLAASLDTLADRLGSRPCLRDRQA